MVLAALYEHALDARRAPLPASYMDLSPHVLLLISLMPAVVLLFSEHLACSRS
jgi:hypothetical protein